MNISWRNVSGRFLLLSIFFFFLGGKCIKYAVRYAGAAASESTTTSHDMQINYYAEIIHADYHFKCDYNFSVDGASYSGGVVCEKSIVDEAIRGKRLGQSGSLPIPNAVVYYNPADPSMNSLKEFSAMSEDDYRMGAGLIGVGVFTIVFVVWGAVLAANQQSENHRMFVEATRRTVTHPEEINYNLGSDGLFNKGRKTEREVTLPPTAKLEMPRTLILCTD
jgi:hypothetical protein